MSHTTDIQLHDRFIFQGLTGTSPAITTEIVVTGIQVDGKVIVRTSWLSQVRPATAVEGEHTYLVPLVDAMHMIEQDIWKLVKP